MKKKLIPVTSSSPTLPFLVSGPRCWVPVEKLYGLALCWAVATALGMVLRYPKGLAANYYWYAAGRCLHPFEGWNPVENMAQAGALIGRFGMSLENTGTGYLAKDCQSLDGFPARYSVYGEDWPIAVCRLAVAMTNSSTLVEVPARLLMFQRFRNCVAFEVEWRPYQSERLLIAA